MERGRKRKNIDVEKAKRLYKEGYTLRQIADEMNCSQTLILNRLQEERFPLRKLTYVYRD